MEVIIKEFKELTAEELYEILKLRINIFIVEQKCPYEECDDKDKNSYHLYLKEDDKILAYLRVVKKGISYDEISIGRVVVNSKYRGQNLGRELMTKAINFITEKLKEKNIRISAQLYLEEFYKSFGFKSVSSQYLEDNIPHIEMLY
jgi:ElaA protein